MKTNIKLAGLAIVLSLSAAAANATVITSINMEVRSSTYTVQGTDDLASLSAEFYSGSQVCDVSLDALDLVGSSQTCGGPVQDIATLFEIHVIQTTDVLLWDFGADWGRGGIIFLTQPGVTLQTAPLVDDFWWALDWNNPDVLRIGLQSDAPPEGYTLGYLGFEGCCGGAMSLRYSEDGGETWQTAAVNAVVPEPSSLALLGLGLFGLGVLGRRKRAL